MGSTLGDLMAGKAISMDGGKPIEEEAREAAIEAFNEENRKAEEAYRKMIDEEITKSNEAKKQAEGLEVMPVGGYVLFKLYANNPYETIERTKSGLILPAFDGREMSKETGQMEKQQRAVEIGHVIEVGPGVVDVRPGDDIFLRGGVMIPVPFLRQGFWVTGQNNILVVVNKGLTERFKKQNDGKQD